MLDRMIIDIFVVSLFFLMLGGSVWCATKWDIH